VRQGPNVLPSQDHPPPISPGRTPKRSHANSRGQAPDEGRDDALRDAIALIAADLARDEAAEDAILGAADVRRVAVITAEAAAAALQAIARPLAGGDARVHPGPRPAGHGLRRRGRPRRQTRAGAVSRSTPALTGRLFPGHLASTVSTAS
jgi:hypothetical protein